MEAKDAEIAGLRAERDADRELIRRLELRLEELERRLRQDSTDSGTPTSKEGIGARERRKVERADPDRGRRKDRKPGGQPGHPGKGLARDPDPGERKAVPPPAECRRCKAVLEGAEPAAGLWAQVIDVLLAVDIVQARYSCPGDSARQHYLQRDIAGGAARYADVIDIQAQNDERDLFSYEQFVAATARQARAAHASVVVLAGLSTDNGTQEVSGSQLYQPCLDVRTLVAAYWLNVPGKSPELRGTYPKPALALLQKIYG